LIFPACTCQANQFSKCFVALSSDNPVQSHQEGGDSSDSELASLLPVIVDFSTIASGLQYLLCFLLGQVNSRSKTQKYLMICKIFPMDKIGFEGGPVKLVSFVVILRPQPKFLRQSGIVGFRTAAERQSETGGGLFKSGNQGDNFL